MTETITENTIMTIGTSVGEVFVQQEKPPQWIYQGCIDMFGSVAEDNIFTYGHNIYAQKIIPNHTIAHEMCHVKQQIKVGKDIWWQNYFKDRRFRMEQEVEAFRAQYQVMKESMSDRNQLDKALRWLSGHLAKDYKLEINMIQAAALIKNK